MWFWVQAEWHEQKCDFNYADLVHSNSGVLKIRFTSHLDVNIADSSASSVSEQHFVFRITVTSDGTLWIHNISRADEGKYTCFAENYLGKANSTGHLSVRGKLSHTDISHGYWSETSEITNRTGRTSIGTGSHWKLTQWNLLIAWKVITSLTDFRLDFARIVWMDLQSRVFSIFESREFVTEIPTPK